MVARRLIQRAAGGPLEMEDMVRPAPSATEVIVATRASLISGGTETATRQLAGSSLLAKARARPDLVRKVVERARAEGVGTARDLVRSRLGEAISLGYSAAGTVLEVGEAVADVRPGDRVATAGAGHGDLQIVAGNLAARLPGGVSFEDGAFAGVGSIALNALRLGAVGPGDRILVVGLGLVGQLCVRLAVVAGAEVVGVDPVEWKRELARSDRAAVVTANREGWDDARSVTGGIGFDAVLVAAASRSSEPARRAVEAVRSGGKVVVVGDVGMQLDRRALYEREAMLIVARSYGPGRYDPAYERLGIDYPIGEVRWTAGRNLGALVGLIADSRLVVSDLITHRYPFEQADAAYAAVEDEGTRSLGVLFTYRGVSVEGAVPIQKSTEAVPTQKLAVGAIGAGRFARETLFPALAKAGFGPFRLVSSATGAGAARAQGDGLFLAVAEPEQVIADPTVSLVAIASDHASHAPYVVSALAAGKHVYCEKPLAISTADLRKVVDAWRTAPGTLMVGHNRRWSPAVARVIEFMGPGPGPLQVLYRVAPGPLPGGHWLRDRRQGGRILGEICHFIDTCSAIVGSEPERVWTLTSKTGELLLEDTVTVVLGFEDGSQATVVYGASAAEAGSKEYLEVLGRRRRVVVDDFASFVGYGPEGKSTHRWRPADKGHTRQMEVLAEVVSGRRDGESITREAVETTAVSLAVIHSATSGEPVQLGPWLAEYTG